MKHLKTFNEQNLGTYGSTLSTYGSTSATRLGSIGAKGNTGTAGGFTGPVAFHANNNILGHLPTDGPTIPVEYKKNKLPDYSKAKLKQSLVNDVQGKNRKRPEDELYGTSKRRINKLKSKLRKKTKGLFSTEKEKSNTTNKKSEKIKKFSEFNKDD